MRDGINEGLQLLVRRGQPLEEFLEHLHGGAGPFRYQLGSYDLAMRRS